MKLAFRAYTNHTLRRSRALARLVWRGVKWLIPWMWQFGRWALLALWRLAGCSMHATWHVGGWLLQQLLAPCLCFSCIYSGVLLTLLLPTSLWSALVSSAFVNFIAQSLPTSPSAEIPDIAHLGKALLTALPLAMYAFRYGYLEWKTSLDPLGARMLYACAVGVTWPKLWFRRKQPQTNLS